MSTDPEPIETAPEAEAEVEGDSPAPIESEPPAATMATGDISRAHLKGLIEALVFVSEHPVSVNEIAKAAGRAEKKLVRALVDELRQEYSRRGFNLEEVAGGLIFRTNAAYAPFVRDVAAKKPVRMTRAQLETLAIIAYRQPLTRPEVDDIRGVDSGAVLKMLLDRDLVKILGKKEEPGRPLVYGTTPVFLEFFGLKSLKDLPSLREFTELSDESRRVYDREMEDLGGEPGGGETTADVGALAAAASAVGAAEEPVGAAEEPVGAAEEPVGAAEEPVGAAEESARAGDAPATEERQSEADLPEAPPRKAAFDEDRTDPGSNVPPTSSDAE